ncbi:MAG: hypothetical protein HFG53_00390 [Lachnospiraceae bacterium]|jgi:hypothetical protein|nr:hypothetical protein [Lachnospiraceae bacterium]
MIFGNRLFRSWKKDLQTLKTLSLRQKLRFLADYYKGYLFLAFCLLLLMFYLGDMFWQSRQTIDLQGFFVNDRQNLFPAKKLMQDFSSYQKTAPGHRIAFEDSLFVDLDSGSEYHAASQAKIMAYTAAKELDFLVVPAELASHYVPSFPLCDLDGLLSKDPALKELASPDLIYGEDGSKTAKACCLNLQSTRFLQDPAYDGTEAYYLLVLSYTEHEESLLSFLRYAYSLPSA